VLNAINQHTSNQSNTQFSTTEDTMSIEIKQIYHVAYKVSDGVGRMETTLTAKEWIDLYDEWELVSFSPIDIYPNGIETSLEMDIKVAKAIVGNRNSRFNHAVLNLVDLAEKHLALAERDEREIDEAAIEQAGFFNDENCWEYKDRPGCLCRNDDGSWTYWVGVRPRELLTITKVHQLTSLIALLKPKP
jgi:hypothetical protein